MCVLRERTYGISVFAGGSIHVRGRPEIAEDLYTSDEEGRGVGGWVGG